MKLRDLIKQSLGKTIQFLEYRIIIKMDSHKLKFVIDILFIINEKIFSKLDKLLPIYIKYYQELIQKEIELAQITEKHKILNIGCGAIPASCILLAKETTANIIGIDKDLESVKCSKKILSRLKLYDKLEIINANAMDFPMNNSDIIIITNGINPYHQLMERIANDMRNDATVVFRTYSHNNEELAPKDYFLKKYFIIGKKTRHKRFASVVSVLLYKKKPKP